MTDPHDPTPEAPRPNPDVVWRRLGETVVLIHVPSSQIFELNHTGARIWELLHDDAGRADVAGRLATEFDISRADADRALAGLVDSLRAERLVR
jgi:hypothetical protein